MFIEADSIANDAVVQTTVCIIGSGPSGMCIALELEKAGIPCCILESGGFKLEPESSRLSEGDSLGLPYWFGEGTRSRYLGGSSNCWGGFVRPWDDSAFGARDWVADSGWPISRSDLDGAYERAGRFLGIPLHDYDLESWLARGAAALDRSGHPWFLKGGAIRRLPVNPDEVEQIITQLSGPIRLAHAYGSHLAASRVITTYLHANAVEIVSAADSPAIDRIRVATLNGRRWFVKADSYVLAAGGIENARILLASSGRQPQGLGNGEDQVGRYFQDHPRVITASVDFARGYRNNPLFDIKYHIIVDDVFIGGQRVCGQLRLPMERQRQEGLLDAQVWFRSLYPGERTEVPRALYRLRQRTLGQRSSFRMLSADVGPIARHPVQACGYIAAHMTASRRLVDSVAMEVIVECEPDPNSRVTLDMNRRDALGLPRTQVDWRIGSNTARTVDRTVELVAQQLERQGIARVQRSPGVEQTGWPAGMDGTYHHMGTTRMSASPRNGVVDRDCRVHGIPNLYIGGSSVFTSSPSNHPTMTLVALSMRLADRLISQLGPSLHQGYLGSLKPAQAVDEGAARSSAQEAAQGQAV